MRICIISTTIMVTPPPGYSGLEMLAHQQADGLAKFGHKVLLVTPRGSIAPTGVELHETTLGESEQQAYSGYWQKLADFDAIIDNSWQKWSYILKMEGKLKAPILGVLHAPCNTMYGKAPPVPNPCLVAISKDQAAHASEIWGVNARVAYNGIDIDFYKKRDIKQNFRYLFLARFSTIKGPHIAIDVAKQCGLGLDLVGDDKLTAEPEYLERIKAQATGNIVFRGAKTRDECVDWFSSNKTMLHMNQFYREPFGLAPVEAMACGLPVIAFDNGAMRETIKHGETGFVTKSVEDVINLVKGDAVAMLKPGICREWASQFSIHNMIKRYDELCKEAVDKGW